MEEKRIDWVDIYKAIGIILVVIGHTTGQFNRYIYQFHMAAFFLIAGYTTNLGKDSLSHYIYKKIYSLFVPLLTVTIVGAGLMALLNATSVYSLLYSNDYPYMNFKNTISIFLKSGDNYVWWLGAAWFIWALFRVEILQKIVFELAGKKDGFLYGFASVVIYIFGYYCIKTGLFKGRMNDLTFIGQIFFWAGHMLRKIGLSRKIEMYGCGCVISMSYLYFAQLFFAATVDYPSRQFGNLFLNFFSGIFGSILLWGLSGVMDLCLKKGKVRNIFLWVGKNTWGILLFHFLAYKIITVPLVVFHILPLSFLQNIKPEGILQKHWFILSILVIIISVYIWTIIKKPCILGVILGEKKWWESFWCRFVKRSFFEIKNGERFSKFVIKRKHVLAVFCIGVLAYMSSMYVFLLKPCIIEFPFKPGVLGVGARVSFGEGWLPQGEEPYRWICENGTLTIPMGKWSLMHVSGYVPDNFINVKTVVISVNEEKVFEKNIGENRVFEEDIVLSDKCKIGSTLKITIAFDGKHVPEEGELDTRELSGLINVLQFR